MSVEEEFALYYADIEDPKYEIVDGEIVMQSAPTDVHSVISGNFYFWTSKYLRDKKSKCLVFHEKGSIQIPNTKNPKTGKAKTYEPDILVDCRYTGKGHSEYPTLIAEVLSQDRNKDIVKKFDVYKQYESLQEYVIIDQYSVEVRVYRKCNDWLPDYYFVGDVVRLDSIGVEMGIDKIYENIMADKKGHLHVCLPDEITDPNC